MAEIENQRRRATQQLEDARNYSISSFAKDLTSVMDNFHRALESVPVDALKTNKELTNLFDGVKMTHAEMQKVFDKYQIKR